MVHSLEGLTRTSKAALDEALGLDLVEFSDSAVVGATSEFFSDTGLLSDRVGQHLLKG